MMRAAKNATAPGRVGPRQLLDRLRFILAVIASMAAVFAVVELLNRVDSLGVFFAFRAAGAALALIGFLVLRARWVERWAFPLTIAIVVFAYVFVALAGLWSPTGEYVTTAILFVGAALFTATVLPWGFAPQCFTVLIGVASLASVILWTDNSLAAIASDPGLVVMMGLVLSMVIASEFEGYRSAHRHELEERRRAEAEVRWLNASLEGRVRERTAALLKLNDRLAVEVAEHQRTNDALEISRRLLADTVDHSSAVVSLKGVDGAYLLVNREFERLFGYPRDAVLGCRDEHLFPSDVAALLQAHDREVLAKTESFAFEQDLPGGDGRRSYVWVKFPLQGSDGRPYGVGSMATDVTALKQLEESLRRHQDELAHVLRVQTMGEIVAAVAHEINQPLGAITNYAEGGSERLRAGRVEVGPLLDAFERIVDEGLRAGEILRGIRSLIRREDGEEGEVDVCALAREAVKVLEPQARRFGVSVHVESGETLPSVRGNPTQIEQVMINLMLNGVQAVAAGDRDRREVVLAASQTGDVLEVAVRDSGGGISADVASKLFSPFVTTKPSGLGLGLAISRTIVENHGGRLWATSTAEEGATFCFSLPLVGPADSTLGVRGV